MSKTKRTVELTDTDKRNVKIIKRLDPHCPTTIAAIRVALAAHAAQLEAQQPQAAQS